MTFSAVKSVVFDFDGTNYGGTYRGLRSIDFWSGGSKISLATSDFAAYCTSKYSTYDVPFVFDTSLSKTGSSTGTSWMTISSAGQRLICVFNTARDIDEIRVNNYHNSGTATTIGCKNVKIHVTPNTITDTTYNADVPNGTLIYDGTFRQHVSSNVVDEQNLVLSVGSTTELEDMAMDIQAFCSAAADAGLDIAAGYQAMESCPVDIQTLGVASRDNMLDIAVGFLGMMDLPISVMLAKEINMNVVMDILLSEGIITRNMAMDINVGDGNKRQDLGVDIMAVTARPEFKYVYAMNLTSVIKEITS